METEEYKPISDTPETDESAWFDNDEGWWVSRSVARRLERGRKCYADQLAIAEKRIAELETELRQK